jgi:hypothetical protein
MGLVLLKRKVKKNPDVHPLGNCGDVIRQQICRLVNSWIQKDKEGKYASEVLNPGCIVQWSARMPRTRHQARTPKPQISTPSLPKTVLLQWPIEIHWYQEGACTKRNFPLATRGTLNQEHLYLGTKRDPAPRGSLPWRQEGPCTKRISPWRQEGPCTKAPRGSGLR